MRKRAQAGHFIVFQPSECVIHLNLFDGRLLECSDWHDLALAFDSVYDVAESVLLSKALCWNLLAFEGARSESNLIRESSAVNNLSLALSREEGLYLIENVAQFEFGII